MVDERCCPPCLPSMIVCSGSSGPTIRLLGKGAGKETSTRRRGGSSCTARIAWSGENTVLVDPSPQDFYRGRQRILNKRAEKEAAPCLGMKNISGLKNVSCRFSAFVPTKRINTCFKETKTVVSPTDNVYKEGAYATVPIKDCASTCAQVSMV